MIIGIILLGGMVEGVLAQNISIGGQVRTAQPAEAVDFAHVVLLTNDSAFVKGVATDEKGNFLLDKVKAGDYVLKASALGYQTHYRPLAGVNKSIVLEDIVLEEEVVALDGVTVEAANWVNRTDRKLVFPSERQVKLSTNGVNLLQQLMLPRVQVNPLFDEVSVSGGGEIQFRINGAKVELQEIVALQPAEIIRIEYHDNPGLRYGDAEIVLDYIVRRPETGGNLGLNFRDGLTAAWGNNFVFGKINHKKSEFSVNYDISHRDFYKVWRDNEEQFTFAGGSTLHRKEEGEPGHLQLNWQNLNVTYNFTEADKTVFNATLRYYNNNLPHEDYRGVLRNVANPADAVDMTDKSTAKNSRPAIDLYFQQSLKNDQTLVLNVVGTLNRTENSRLYRESRGNTLLTDVNNRVNGRKYSLIGEGIYEKKLAGANRISGGLRHTQAFSDNEYMNGHDYTTRMNQAQTFLYGEFKGKVSALDYTLGASVIRDHFKQENESDGDGYENYTFNPRMVLHYTLPGKSFIRLRADINNASPTLSELSDVTQTIDSLQVQRGNPLLKPYLRYRTELTYELQKGIFYGNLMGRYEIRPHAIMNEKRLEGDKIVQTWDNQKDWQHLNGQLMLRVGPVKDFLQFSATGGVNHYISNGNLYRHVYTNWFMDGNVSANYKKFTFVSGLETHWNYFYGEAMYGGENIHYVQLDYRHKELSVSAGMFNPFVNNYKQDEENWSQYASYKKSRYINESSHMFLMSLTYNFSFGRKFNANRKRLDNSDDDSGVMSTGK